MARELRIELNDDEYEPLAREARERHEDPTAYAGRVLAQELNKARFLEGSASSSPRPACARNSPTGSALSPAPPPQRRRRAPTQ